MPGARSSKGITLGEMRHRKHETEGFPTPGGKVKLYSSVMEHLSLAPLPECVESPLSPVSTPDLAGRFPFILMIGCKVKPFSTAKAATFPNCASSTPSLAEMHPEAARALGLADGQSVVARTPHGAQRFYLRHDESLQPDVVHVEHAWWFAEEPGPEHSCFRSNANLLFGHAHFDPHSGTEALKCGLCGVEGTDPQASAGRSDPPDFSVLAGMR